MLAELSIVLAVVGFVGSVLALVSALRLKRDARQLLDDAKASLANAERVRDEAGRNLAEAARMCDAAEKAHREAVRLLAEFDQLRAETDADDEEEGW